MPVIHGEKHRTERISWLRAAVLGANDGIISTASLILGVAASDAGRDAVLVAGTAALVAGAMSMAAGEYVSVSAQADTEQADLERECKELAANPDFEVNELALIYQHRGLQPDLAREVALQLMAHDALSAHARDELGLFGTNNARPAQAAMASACSFATGAALPMLVALLLPDAMLVGGVVAFSLLCLVALGSLAAKSGGAPVRKAAIRVAGWGALAMAITAGTGYLFDVFV